MKAIQKLDKTIRIEGSGSNVECDTFETSEPVIVGKNVLLAIKKISDKNIFILEKGAILEFYIESSLHIIQSCENKLVATQLVSKSKIIDFFISYYTQHNDIDFTDIPLNQFYYFREYDKQRQDDAFKEMCYFNNLELTDIDKSLADNWHTIYALAKDPTGSTLNVLSVELISYIFSFVGGDINFNHPLDKISNDDYTSLTGQNTEVSYE